MSAFWLWLLLGIPVVIVAAVGIGIWFVVDAFRRRNSM